MRHFLEADEEWWDGIIDVNLKGHFLCTHRAAHDHGLRSARA